MPRHDLTTCARWTAVLALTFLPACGKREPPPPVEPAPAAVKLADETQKAKDQSLGIEAFTGGRTRIVWSQFQKTDATDPRSNKAGHFLMGLDTKTGLGARPLIAKEDNYTRPLLTSDGETILYTRKAVTWDAQDVKHYSTVIMRTDWSGSAPVEISDGYAVDVWRDPATRIEWVYAVRDIIPSPLVSLEAKKLVRFQLTDTTQQELIWDQTKVSPDNIQLSRDGRRASGQFPWPDAGQFILEQKRSFKKILTGAWPSVAPDNSYASWILDAGNKSLTVFIDEASKPWTVALTTTPDLARGEINHPHWTNHPRFLTLTGPYLPAADPSEGSAVGKGGLSSEVFIGKFSDKLDKIDAWFRVTDNALNDNYPDVWIEGGDTAELSAFNQVHATKPAAPKWPVSTDGVVFLWQDRDAKSAVKLPNGSEFDCTLSPRGAARFGRKLELLLDAGSFIPKEDAANLITDALQSSMPLTVEFVLHIDGDIKAAYGTLATFPHLRLTLRDGIINAETSSGIIGIGPVQGNVTHLTAAAGDTGYAVTLQEADGKSMSKITAAKPRASPSRSAAMAFGGGGGKGIGMSHIAIYVRALSPQEIRDHAKLLPFLDTTPASATLKLRGKLIQASPMPAAADIIPATSALIQSVYEVTKVIEGDYTAKQILVQHWGLMDGKPVLGFPRKIGLEFDLLVQPIGDHPQISGIPVTPLEAKDLSAWLDVSTPSVGR